MKKIALLLSIAMTLSGCGYALVGRGNFLPSGITTVHIPPFVNRTTRVELEQQVTQSVAEEMVSRSRLRIVADEKQSDSVLRGTITSFAIQPVAYENAVATQYQVSVTASIELVDRRNDEQKVIWKNDQYRFTETYPINLQSGDAFDQESRAIREIARQFAETLVASLLEGF